MQKHKRILICPLDWGLGHATRCIPIIRLLLKKNAEVLVAADAGPLALLKKEFPALTFIPLGGYNITYPKTGSMNFKMLLSIPKILTGIKEEHSKLEQIINDYAIDIVISDNRYGCWNKKVKSIFITHQLMIKAPFGERFLHTKIVNYISQYDECWIPDVIEENNLSGDLSHTYELPKNTFFVGKLSRFHLSPDSAINSNNSLRYDVMAIISGPEPQRSIFEKLILKQLKGSNLKALVVLGKAASETKTETIDKITLTPHLQSQEMQEAMLQSKIILARSGYSTIMDLATLNKKAIFIPTPGQTEQEYLAGLVMKKGVAFSQSQNKFDLPSALKMSENYSGFKTIENGDQLEKRIDLLVS